MAKNKLPLARPFQHAIICPQQTEIGEDIEVWPSPKVGVNGQIIVIFVKIDIFEIVSIYFLRPPKRFLDETFLS